MKWWKWRVPNYNEFKFVGEPHFEYETGKFSI